MNCSIGICHSNCFFFEINNYIILISICTEQMCNQNIILDINVSDVYEMIPLCIIIVINIVIVKIVIYIDYRCILIQYILILTVQLMIM